MNAPALKPNPPAIDAPGLRPAAMGRRLMAFVYESMVLFGLALLPGAIGALFVKLLGAETAFQGEGRLRWIAFLIFAVYFVWCWSRSGQTLPMQTWRIRLQTRDGQLLSQKLAFQRFLLAWLWIAPGWLVAHGLGWRGWQTLVCVAINIVVYALIALRMPEKQFWHDVRLGTRIVDLRP